MQSDIQVNDLVIAKLKGFDWWFGKVISHRSVRKPLPMEGNCWIYWYGDHKISEVCYPIRSTSFASRYAEK